ncbi:MAG TPA: hypothetical protein PLC04_07520 [Candidatus Kapabacteria bacterium]|jgi:hypothetical protein|nr:hypothetical protein [Candidatus Kapabacteria bacterium]HOV92906.1 hypothetical protein [Candidatus Kapabacteria bacterium]
MASGGPARVYFVLYLAVVLELLITIVDRDEAEEGLARKQRETMKIVQSILSQLQSGAGTEGINTKPKDEITIPPPGIDIRAVMGADIKSFRQYVVSVGVTDISGDLRRNAEENEKEYYTRLKKLVKLANVEQIQYQIFYNSTADPTAAPPFPSDEDIRKSKIDFANYSPGQLVEVPNFTGPSWEFLGMTEINLDEDATYNRLDLNNLSTLTIEPVYPPNKIKRIGQTFAPSGLPPDSAFFYSHQETMRERNIKSQGLLKRDFIINFQPPSRAGWYKLRIFSRTNRILGIRGGMSADEVPDEMTINIGTVQLTVKDLRTVLDQLTLDLDAYNPPSPDILFKENDLDKFLAKLDESKQMAMKSDNASEVISNLNLYGYIVRLLAPGQSVNFDQNKSSMEFDVRVITPTPTISEPTVSALNYIGTFDKVPLSFDFSIAPFQGEGSNVLEGKIFDSRGAKIDNLLFKPLDQIPGSGVNPPIKGGSREFRAYTNNPLSPGKYTIELTHSISTRKSVPVAVQVEVFPTGLTDESQKEINNRLSAYSYYGLTAFLNAVPTSGSKIKNDQFRTYLYTDIDQQRPPFVGLTVTSENGVFLKPPATKLNLRITWIQPGTNTEVDIFPLKTFPIKQEEPNIIVRNILTDVSGTAAKFKVTVSNILVSKVQTGIADQDPKIEVSVGQPSLDGLGSYSPSIEPTIDGDVENGYTLRMEFSGKLERGQTRIRGTINVPLQAVAINPANGVKSEPRKITLQIPINFEPERGGGPRRR